MKTYAITLFGELVSTFKMSAKYSLRDVKNKAVAILHDKGYLNISGFRVWKLVGIGWTRKKPAKRAIVGKKATTR